MSKLEEFERFVEKISKYRLLHPTYSGESTKPVIVLIDDLPVTNGRVSFLRLSKCLTSLVRWTRVPTVILITEYHKTESLDSSMHYWEEVESSLVTAGAHKVAFNPVTVNSIKKTLSRICQVENCDVSAEWIDQIARASGGDIRHAVTALQYFCLRTDNCFSLPVSTLTGIHSDANVGKPRSLSSQGLEGYEDLNKSRPLPFGRDETLNLFHALGKFLHNKRETLDAFALEQGPFILRDNLMRKPLKMHAPEEVLSHAHGQARSVADFLHENVIDFLSDEAIDDAWLVTSYLSDADFLLASALHPSRSHMMSGVYESESVSHSVAASVAVRGVLFGNSHPSPSRWHTIRSPRLWQIEQSLRCNKNQMRIETYNNCSLFNTLRTAFEYGSIIQWLRSRSTEIHNPMHEKLMYGGEDDSELMDPKNSRGNRYSEESEEDEIEDW